MNVKSLIDTALFGSAMLVAGPSLAQAGVNGYCSADEVRTVMKTIQDYSYLDKHGN